jgi:hypothetical protein
MDELNPRSSLFESSIFLSGVMILVFFQHLEGGAVDLSRMETKLRQTVRSPSIGLEGPTQYN